MGIENFTSNGIKFVKNNPQLLYTLFLVIVIPLAFILTSEQFLKIARKQNDVAEQGRIGLLHDAFATLLPTQPESEQIDAHIQNIASRNETLTGFYVVEEYLNGTGTRFEVVGSLNKQEVPLGAYIPDPTAEVLMRFALANPGESLTSSFVKNTARAWKTIRVVPLKEPNISRAYIATDVSMSNTDAVLARNIRNAYFLLIAVVALIILMLARQARIIDYATLYKRLEEVDKMKDDFVSITAHELRSPLTTIRAFIEKIKDTQPLNDDGVETLNHIDDSVKDLNVLINDILDVAKLQEGRMSFNFTPVNPAEVLSEVFTTYEAAAIQKGLSLKYEKIDLPNILVDKIRFRQVIVNLVSNAVKYTKTGSVSIVAKINEGRNLCEIRVSDTGLGIGAEAQKRLFSKFYRVKTTETEKISGTGLGLWITAEIVRQMKGEISVESIEGKGSDFIVRIPLAQKNHI